MKELTDMCLQGAAKKDAFLKDRPGGYFVSAMWAGASIGIGTLLIAVLGAYGEQYGFAMTKAVMGFSFSVALSIVIMWGLELFTGSVFFMSMGGLRKRISWRRVLYIWFYTYVGNFAGALVLAFLYRGSGVGETVLQYLVKMVEIKTAPGFMELLIRGILCNILVCLAVLIAYKMKSESGKLMMIFWCIYTFVILGFEHSVANMTLFSVTTLFGYTDTITPFTMFHSMFPVTLGNILGGGLFVAGSLHYMSGACGCTHPGVSGADGTEQVGTDGTEKVGIEKDGTEKDGAQHGKGGTRYAEENALPRGKEES